MSRQLDEIINDNNNIPHTNETNDVQEQFEFSTKILKVNNTQNNENNNKNSDGEEKLHRAKDCERATNQQQKYTFNDTTYEKDVKRQR